MSVCVDVVQSCSFLSEFDGDLLYFDLVNCARFAQPQKVYIEASVNQHPRTLFFGITEPSSGRCLAAQIRGDVPGLGISVQTWLDQQFFLLLAMGRT